jgi:hypothetical protein
VTEVHVVIRGLPELAAAFGQVRSNLPREMSQDFLAVSQKVASSASGKVPRRTGRAAGSIQPQATKGGASIVAGAGVPYYPWLDFGGAVGRNGSVVRPYVASGRYLFPAMDEHDHELVKAADDAVERTVKAASFETTGSNG